MDEEMWKPRSRESLAHDRAIIRELFDITRQALGSLRERKLLQGINDGSDEQRDFRQPWMEEPREEVLADHRAGKHAKLEHPQLDCPSCQARLAQFRRRQDARMDVVVALGGKCEVCWEPVLARAARFVHRRGFRSVLTQMFQFSYGELLEAARDYALICPKCSREGGRKKIVEKERASVPVGLAPVRKARADKGKRSPRRANGWRERRFRAMLGSVNEWKK